MWWTGGASALVLVLVLVPIAWAFVLCWYLLWGIWLVPYRLLRRSQRKDKMRVLQHREMLGAIAARDDRRGS